MRAVYVHRADTPSTVDASMRQQTAGHGVDSTPVSHSVESWVRGQNEWLCYPTPSQQLSNLLDFRWQPCSGTILSACSKHKPQSRMRQCTLACTCAASPPCQAAAGRTMCVLLLRALECSAAALPHTASAPHFAGKTPCVRHRQFGPIRAYDARNPVAVWSLLHPLADQRLPQHLP